MLTRTPALYHLSQLVGPDAPDHPRPFDGKDDSQRDLDRLREADTFGWADLMPVSRSLEDRSCLDDMNSCDHMREVWIETNNVDDGFYGQIEPQEPECPRVTSPPRQKTKKKNDNNTTTENNRCVSFSRVEVLEYSVVLGDHPCSASLALSLGWERAPSPAVVDIDEYELSRMGRRRHGRDLHLSYYERKNILKNVGGLKETDIIRNTIEKRRARSLSQPKHLQSVMLI
uniref:Uncharacterized protein n=1 Tax=Pseudictyota dubia TaxID=2749911 RepID=A0A7R9YWW8_9STRA|mmetsp:Transcript_10040/g.19172  ORF Transcript_10040/g.19172 Transcript_10040/m.19172 type:complete len:229 (+) Transcript_10040:171-857(+)